MDSIIKIKYSNVVAGYPQRNELLTIVDDLFDTHCMMKEKDLEKKL